MAKERIRAQQRLFFRATQQGLLRLLSTKAVMAPYGIDPLSNMTAWDIGQFLANTRHQNTIRLLDRAVKKV